MPQCHARIPHRVLFSLVLAAAVSALPGPLAAEAASHAGRLTSYEGSRTCNQCHWDKAHEVHASVHYQWKGATPGILNATGLPQGKLGSMNDFCTYPDISFIGLLTNLDGQIVDGGCAQCHIGLGKKPEPTATQVQVENIDCLLCHSDSYRRKVVPQPDGTFGFAPAPERMSVPLLQAITDIRRTPSRRACLQCHAYAGGGDNNKRGDIESTHLDPPRSLDVHLASKQQGGAGLTCVACHRTRNHRIAGRGTDLRPTDLSVKVACTNCHESRPHGSYYLDRHTARVDCTVCHIPAFARGVSTDMLRDFSRPAEVDPVKRLYEPHIQRQGNVAPEYRFFNGLSTFYDVGTPAEPAADGSVVMSAPLGDVRDPAAKLHAFKHHRAVQARDVATRTLIPLKMGLLFQTGNVAGAITRGASDFGLSLPLGYDFVPTERYMGIFHQVAPAEQALTCTACHDAGSRDGGRMPFARLGYAPVPARDPNVGTCSSGCHKNMAGKWQAREFFVKLHEKHVKDKKLDCAACHAFSRARS
jgi:hypothetical protein